MLKSRWKSLLEMFWKFCMLLHWRTLILKTLTCFLTGRHSFLRHWIIRLFSWNPQGSNFQNINFVTAVACLLPISIIPMNKAPISFGTEVICDEWVTCPCCSKQGEPLGFGGVICLGFFLKTFCMLLGCITLLSQVLNLYNVQWRS